MSRRIHAHRMTSGARLARALPPVALGGILLALGFSTGEIQGYVRSVRHLIEVMPLPEPGLNGYAVACLAALVGGCWWQMRQVRSPEREQLERLVELDKQEKWPRGREPLAGCPWPGDPGFGTAPFADVPVARRRLHPVIPAEDRDPDPEEVGRTLLPVRAEGRVR